MPRNEEILATLLRTSEQLARELSLEPLLQKITDEATRLCRAQFGAFFYNQTGPGGESYALFTISGIPRAAFAGYPMPRNTPLFGPTFSGDGVVRCDDVREDPRYGKNPPHAGMPAGHPPVVSYLAVPVKLATGQVLGGLFFGHPDRGVFTHRDEELISAVAAQAAVALDNSRLYEQARSRAKLEAARARLAEEVGRALTSAAEMPEKLAIVCEAIVTQLELPGARIWMVDEGKLEARATAGAKPPGELAEAVARDRRAQRVGPVAAYPLLAGERALGVLEVLAPEGLSETSTRLLASVADHVSIVLERERTELEREQFRELFLGMLGHDLRNPLSAILTGVQALLGARTLDDRQRRMLERMLRSGDRMTRMITQLLDFTRARGGVEIPLERGPADLFAICRDVVEELRASYPGRTLDVAYTGSGDGAWDADRMAQVFSNLVGNALHYGREDRPVRVTVAREEDWIRCTVQSHGDVIPDAVMATLFDPFRRGPTHRKSIATQGLGLGLYITKQIIVAHGGDIAVSSNSDEGTIFRFDLPLHGISRTRDHR